MKKRTPQEKKALSYAKDRRNIYGENDKASRKNIPLRKASVNRGYRRKINQVLHEAAEKVDLESAELFDSKARNIEREDWKKYPDAPLGEVVERKLKRRENHAGKGKTARKRVEEFVENLKIELEQETDGRWIADAVGLNGVIAYSETRERAIKKCESLARCVFLEKLDAGEIIKIDDDYISVLTN